MRPPRPLPDAAPLTVLIADPDPLLRAGLAAVLGADARFTVVAAMATNPEAVVEQVLRYTPALLVIDPVMPEGLDIPLLGAVGRQTPQCAICVYTQVAEPQACLDAVLAGAGGYLLKGGLAPAALCDALALIGQARVSVLDPTLAATFRDRHAGSLFLNTFQQFPALTDRDRMLLARLVAGSSRAELATETGVSERTIYRAVATLARALGAPSDIALGFRATSFGLSP